MKVTLLASFVLWASLSGMALETTPAPAPAKAAPAPAAAPATASFAAPTVAPAPTLPITTHGQTVTIFGTGFPNAAIKVLLRTGSETKGDTGIPIAATASTDGKNVSFKVPDSVPAGDYLVALSIDGKELPVPGDLRIVADSTVKPAIDSISPSTDYMGADQNAFSFEISGQNLAQVATDNTVIRVDSGPLPAGTAEECADAKAMAKYQKICLSYESGMEGRKLRVSNYRPGNWEGPASFKVQVGNNVSNAQQLVFSHMRAETLRWTAIGIFLVIFGIVLALVWNGVKGNRVAGESTGVVGAFFLDRQSNSYSLSKFQVLAWTSVAVFGYVYLFLCRVFIQWKFGLPPIPDGLPSLLGVSAGTTVAAAAITANRGSKGSGPLHPSWADFISTGGLVVGERFQFFVWTIIGCGGFLAAVLASDPASLTDLPDIKGGLLTLMGLSSAGYLAGKLVRPPGPVIELLTIQEVIPGSPPPPGGGGGTPGVIKLQVKGQNLSESAVVKVGNKQLRMDEYQLRGITAQDQPTGYFTLVEIDLLDAEEYRTGTHLLFLVNDDGQSACESFPMNPLTVNPVSGLQAGSDPVTVKLTGRNFAAGVLVNWTPPQGAMQAITSDNVAFVDEGHLNVNLVPGVTAGTGTLSLITPANLVVNVPVVVNKPPSPPKG
jgi:hypothetical protein